MALLSRLRRSTLVAAGLLFLVGAATLTYTYRDTLGLAETPRDEQVENLRAFAKLYGYVRYFHPSDAAAETDWDKLAIGLSRELKVLLRAVSYAFETRQITLLSEDHQQSWGVRSGMWSAGPLTVDL